MITLLKAASQLKKQIQDNSEHFNKSMSLMRNTLDPVYDFESGEECIEQLPSCWKRIVRGVIPGCEPLKTLVSPKKLNILSYISLVFNPKTGRLKDSIPSEGISPIIMENIRLMRKFLNIDIGITPMIEDELAYRGRLWKCLNMATEELISGFLLELGTLEAPIAGIIGYDASDCVLHLVMSQSADSVSFIYGNLFTIVKLGVSTKLCFNYSLLSINSAVWDGLAVYSNLGLIPDSIQDFVKVVCRSEGISGGHHHCTICPSGIKLEGRSQEILDRVGKAALGLKGILPTPHGKL